MSRAGRAGLAALVAVLAGALAACQGERASAPAPAARVLVLAPPGSLSVTLAAQAIARRNGEHPPAEALQVDSREVRSAAEATEAVRAALAKPVAYRAIFSPSQTFARAAQLLVTDRPIVFDGIDDPVGNCLVDTLRRPGRNATGYMHLLPDTEQKMIEVLHDGFPALREVLVLVSGHNVMPQSCAADDPVRMGLMPPCVAGVADPAAVQRMIDAQGIVAYARGLGLRATFLELCSAQDFARVAARTQDARVGVVVPWHSLFDDEATALVAALSRAAGPAIYPSARHVAAGGTLALEPLRDGGRYRASVVALLQVLDGRDPAELPVQAPRGYEIALNAGAAARQGLQPSLRLLRRADRILP
jgi:putative ABC transport system substrate-binding protein